MTVIEMVRGGPLTTVQDLGRPGWAHLGVPRSGALDIPAMRLANALVGNPTSAAVLETTLSGCAVRFSGDVVVAVAGADAPLTVDGRPARPGTALDVALGDVVAVGPARIGVRSYLAIRGGVAVDPVLGSRSTDTLSGIGPPPMTDSLTQPLGRPDPSLPSESPGTIPTRALPTAAGVLVRVRLGPRDDWLTPAGLDALVSTRWTVSPASNRVGARLVGPALERAVTEELASEGMVLGAVQVPTDGTPLVFLADHPTTGGYPAVAVVEPEDLPLLAQARPGTPLRFAVDGS